MRWPEGGRSEAGGGGMWGDAREQGDSTAGSAPAEEPVDATGMMGGGRKAGPRGCPSVDCAGACPSASRGVAGAGLSAGLNWELYRTWVTPASGTVGAAWVAEALLFALPLPSALPLPLLPPLPRLGLGSPPEEPHGRSLAGLGLGWWSARGFSTQLREGSAPPAMDTCVWRGSCDPEGGATAGPEALGEWGTDALGEAAAGALLIATLVRGSEPEEAVEQEPTDLGGSASLMTPCCKGARRHH